jgi:hypothetical protein
VPTRLIRAELSRAQNFGGGEKEPLLVSPKKQRRSIRHAATLTIPDPEQSKAAVLNTLASADSRRSYQYAIERSIAWYCDTPRLAFERAVVMRYRSFPRESLPLGRWDQPSSVRNPTIWPTSLLAVRCLPKARCNESATEDRQISENTRPLRRLFAVRQRIQDEQNVIPTRSQSAVRQTHFLCVFMRPRHYPCRLKWLI